MSHTLSDLSSLDCSTYGSDPTQHMSVHYHRITRRQDRWECGKTGQRLTTSTRYIKSLTRFLVISCWSDKQPTCRSQTHTELSLEPETSRFEWAAEMNDDRRLWKEKKMIPGLDTNPITPMLWPSSVKLTSSTPLFSRSTHCQQWMAPSLLPPMIKQGTLLWHSWK